MQRLERAGYSKGLSIRKEVVCSVDQEWRESDWSSQIMKGVVHYVKEMGFLKKKKKLLRALFFFYSFKK